VRILQFRIQGKMLIFRRKRTEKQIKETQEKSDKIRTEVSCLLGYGVMGLM